MPGTPGLYRSAHKDGTVVFELVRRGYPILKSSCRINDNPLYSDALTMWRASTRIGKEEYASIMLDFYTRLVQDETVEIYERKPEMQVITQKGDMAIPAELLLENGISEGLPDIEHAGSNMALNLRTPYGNIKTIWPSSSYFGERRSFDLPKNPVVMAFRSGLYVPDHLADLIVSTAPKGVSRDEIWNALDEIYSFGAGD